MARTNHTKVEIANYIKENYYSLEQTIDEIRDTYEYNDSCQGTVPQAIQAFIESVDFEDAIRNAISIGGDSDTIGAITGGIAAAFYGIPDNLRQKAINYLDGDLRKILYEFESF